MWNNEINFFFLLFYFTGFASLIFKCFIAFSLLKLCKEIKQQTKQIKEKYKNLLKQRTVKSNQFSFISCIVNELLKNCEFCFIFIFFLLSVDYCVLDFLHCHQIKRSSDRISIGQWKRKSEIGFKCINGDPSIGFFLNAKLKKKY